ncbi:tyrosine-type recombinase/integrase [Actinocrinis puniceicyclus]|uniref:Tyrosine-type recombinase/integrase n=1 Tax=Actinocrinis puniceicyclus TaxID=977794 RepID=A0A8J7WUJ5_9ACTN|nr:tyrosine-type recombinase/integrase [Actinocrinis puniceicyclus]MBS2966717.1 tyrosine-type recombinase/integrase [Actinocrinis puniceicyclus]
MTPLQLPPQAPVARSPVEPPAAAGTWHGPHADELGQATAAWLAAKKPTTREAYARDLRAWGVFCADHGMHVLTARKPDADLFGAALQDPGATVRPLSAPSAARRMAAVSSWYRYLVACGLHDRNPFAAAERPRVDRDYSATAWLDENSARRIIDAADTAIGSTRLRDAAMLRLMLQLGVRVSEVCSMRVDALGSARGQRTITVHGKGGKRIERALPPAAAEALDAYLTWRADRSGEPIAANTPLFATASGRPVDRTEVFRLVRRLAERAELPQPHAVTPHALRHTFATIATERGADLDDLQDAMGHADPRTTRRYQRAARRLERDPAHLVAAALG